MHCQSAPQGDFTVLEATNAGRSTLKVTGMDFSRCLKYNPNRYQEWK
jgi:hypothetical protein